MRASDPRVGQTLDDRYQIVRRIARGGMSIVFEAIDLRLARTVAIKVMKDGGDAVEVAERFDTEARLAALLSHPHVVAVFDQGCDGDSPYIVMEYVRGLTLRQLIVLEAPFTPTRALELFEQIVSAIAHSHGEGLIHRDIKPENVLINERGQLKVTDFGLARSASEAAANKEATLIGTVSYIAPELITSGIASPRSDVYSLGIMLFELLTGDKPYRADNASEVAHLHVNQDVPVPSIIAKTAIPPSLDAIVAMATARNPKERYTDARALLTAVRAARASGRTRMRQTRPVASAARPRTAASATHARTAPRARVLASASGGPSLPSPVPPSPKTPKSSASPPLVVPPPSTWARSRTYRVRRAGAALVVLLALVSITFGGWWLVAGRLPAIPAVAGLGQLDAQTKMANSGLRVTVVREHSETVPSGIVTRTDPAQGARVQPGTNVLVFLSQGARQFEVPDIKGKTRDEALRVLADTGMTLGSITEGWDKAPVGTVISQSVPGGGFVKKGVPINFVLSAGIEPIALPDWVGKPTKDATKALVADGFKVKVITDFSPLDPGLVISQNPGVGEAKKGSTITLTSSRGPQQVNVPDVRKKSIAEATAALNAAGFQVEVANPDGPSGTIASQTPGSGRKVSAGSTIVLTVG